MPIHVGVVFFSPLGVSTPHTHTHTDVHSVYNKDYEVESEEGQIQGG